MRIPTLTGTIDRRILINFQVDPEALARVLPEPFRPQLVNGCGMAGICLIRLKRLRPLGLPAFCGLTSENAAHRIAVEWDDEAGPQQGVFVPRRETSSRLAAFFGPRFFPAAMQAARFTVHERDDEFQVEVSSNDGSTHVAFAGRLTTDWTANSVFGSIDDASEFFKGGATSYSPAKEIGAFDGMELHARHWKVEPLVTTTFESSFVDSLPAGSVTFDSALLMRGIEHEWRSRASISRLTPAGRPR